MATKRYECSEGEWRKFWEVTVIGSMRITKWGRIGIDDHLMLRVFQTDTEANGSAIKLIKQKERDGYVFMEENEVRINENIIRKYISSEVGARRITRKEKIKITELAKEAIRSKNQSEIGELIEIIKLVGIRYDEYSESLVSVVLSISDQLPLKLVIYYINSIMDAGEHINALSEGIEYIYGASASVLTQSGHKVDKSRELLVSVLEKYDVGDGVSNALSIYLLNCIRRELDYSYIRFLLKCGANPNDIADGKCLSPMWCAGRRFSVFKDIKLVQILLGYGGDIEEAVSGGASLDEMNEMLKPVDSDRKKEILANASMYDYGCLYSGKENGSSHQHVIIEGSLSETIRNIVSELYDEARKNYVSGEFEYDAETTESLEILLDVRKAWKIQTCFESPEVINRTASMFGGFPYTSSKFPWPHNDANKPLAPLVQINLSEVSALTGIDCGSGLLQCWLDITNANLFDSMRIVSEEEYTKQPADEQYIDYMQFSNVDGGWTWDLVSCEITFEYAGEMCSDWEPYDFFIGDVNGNDHEPSHAEEELIAKLTDLASTYGPSSINGSYIMGHPDYYAIGRIIDFYENKFSNFIEIGGSYFPPSDVGGTAIIFYSMKDGEPSFWFHWGRG